MRRAHPGDFGTELRIAHDEILGEDPFLQDAAFAIDILEERIDRLDTLDEPFGKPRPFVMQEDPRDDVERNDPLGRLVLAIDGKGNAELPKRRFSRLLATPQLGVGRLLDPAAQSGQFGTDAGITRCPHDFVERLFPHRNGKFPIKRCGSMLQRFTALHKPD